MDEADQPFESAYAEVFAQWPVDVTKHDIVSRFGTTRVNACGPADGSPVVLLPGGGATSTVWFANVAVLSRRCRVYAIDPIYDAGLSTYHGDAIKTTADLIAWLDETLDGLGLSSVDLVGHSYHGWVATQFALHRPHRVQRLVLIEPTSTLSAQALPFVLRAIPLFIKRTPARLRALLAWETGGRTLDPAFVDLWTTPYGGRTALVWPKRPNDAALRDLRVPTLVLLAAQSRTHDVGKAAATARRVWPHARVVMLADASHFTVPMRPADDINHALTEFFGDRIRPGDKDV